MLSYAKDNSVTAYFFNDSVNGFQFSDAYETHNMGLRFEKKNQFYQIDLGIVTPDMFEFENKWRTANRSFGELITLGYGKNEFFINDVIKLDMYTKITSQGDFGISGLQSIIHQFANFQDDIDLLETVRMPSKTWFGIGKDLKFIKEDVNQKHHFGILSYVGTDRLSSQPYMNVEQELGSWSQFGRVGVEFVVYDNIISAPPVEASVREVRPVLSFGLKKQLGPLEIQISENLSLPSIRSDRRLYARLFMSASIPLEDILKFIPSKN
tara:strand:- start:262 stop:1062 length:801 start_codon:yes stop_codon:yes gene_type:complete